MTKAEEQPSAESPWTVDAKLLRKIRPETFGPRDWQRLAEASRVARTRRALGHLTRITPRLVRQLADLPESLSRPRVLDVLNRLRLTSDRWRALREVLATADPQRRATLACLAGKIQSAGDFWDYWHEAVERHSDAFALPAEVSGSVLLAPLSDPAALRAEGRRMANCLADMFSDVRAGQTICLRPRNLAHVTAELVGERGAWRPGRILGKGNVELGAEELAPIRAELQRLADLLPCAPPSPDDLDGVAIRQIRAWARARYSEETIARIAGPLRDIRLRSVRPDQAAFAIFQARSRVYVQFLARPPGMGFLCEISSHKYESHMHARLSEPVVTLLKRAGFRS